MVAEKVEAEFTCSCPQLKFLADLPSNNLNNQQNLSWYEVLKPRSTADASQWAVRRFYKLRGKYPIHYACSHGETSQKLQLCGFQPSQSRGPQSHVGNPRHRLGETLEDIWSQGDPSYTYTVNSTSIVAVSQANQESARERERDSFPKMIRGHTWVRWKQAAASYDCERLWLFGAVVCTENWTVTLLQRGGTRRVF